MWAYQGVVVKYVKSVLKCWISVVAVSPKIVTLLKTRLFFVAIFRPVTFSSAVLKTRLAKQLGLNAFQCGSYTTRFIRFYLLFDDILHSQVQ